MALWPERGQVRVIFKLYKLYYLKNTQILQIRFFANLGTSSLSLSILNFFLLAYAVQYPS